MKPENSSKLPGIIITFGLLCFFSLVSCSKSGDAPIRAANDSTKIYGKPRKPGIKDSIRVNDDTLTFQPIVVKGPATIVDEAHY